MNHDANSHSQSITILLISVATVIMSISVGINSVVLPVSLDKLVQSTNIVGLILSLDVIASIFIALMISRIIGHLDVRITLILSTVFRVLPIPLFAYSENVWFWALLIFIHGIGLALFYIITQAWVSAMPLTGKRGLVIGLYNTSFAIGVACGPLLIGSLRGFEQLLQPLLHSYAQYLLIDHGAAISLHASALISLLGTLPLLLLFDPPPALEVEAKISIWKTIRNSQSVMFAVAMAGVSVAGVMSFIVIYGQKNGLDIYDSGLLLSFFVAGSLLLQTPLAWISDYYDRYHVLVAAAFISMCCAALLPIAIYVNYQAWTIMFLWGGVIGAISSIALAMLSDKYRDQEMVSANSGYEIMDNFGGMLGILAIGAGISWLGSDGLPYVIMFSSILYYAYSLRRFKVV